MQKTIFLTILTLLLATVRLPADEGMWLPLLLEQLNETQMRGLGMKMKAEDIYSINKGSLKDAIVHFGGFCTGSLISEQGLVLTNHHCGRNRIQAHSTMANNYLRDGFWARSMADELPNPGLYVTFIIRIDDVSAAVLAGVAGSMAEAERQSQIDRNLAQVRAQAKREPYQEVLIRPFFEGNQYFLFVTETFTDVRLVGAPPQSIGNFGVDTDNWIWPRHTGDFSMFRIYAGKDNHPAAYSPDNVPYLPRHLLPISLDGVAEGDFTLTFGFPGRTNAYLPSTAIEVQVDVLNPVKIGVRDQVLAILDGAMRADPQVRLQYTAKQAGVANAWKKWIGERQGLRRVGGLDKKRKFEAEFQRRIDARPEWKAVYGNLLTDLSRLHREQQPLAVSRDYVSELTRWIELLRLAYNFHPFVTAYENQGLAAAKNLTGDLSALLAGFYKDYRPEIDRRIFVQLMQTYFEKLPPEHQSSVARDQLGGAGHDFSEWAANLYNSTILLRADELNQLLASDPEKLIKTLIEDPAFELYHDIMETSDRSAMAPLNKLQDQISRLQRDYIKAQMLAFPEKTFFPDANGTMRVSYGQVRSYQPRDGVKYEAFTDLDGVMEKYKPGDYEFDVPQRLRELYAKKDYGPYGSGGRMPVCFIDNSHITGGNSGSPAIDGSGNLIGLAFDGAWEGVVSDLYYDPAIARTIFADIRYVLFIVDKYAGATNLIREMKLVHPKSAAKKK